MQEEKELPGRFQIFTPSIIFVLLSLLILSNMITMGVYFFISLYIIIFTTLLIFCYFIWHRWRDKRKFSNVYDNKGKIIYFISCGLGFAFLLFHSKLSLVHFLAISVLVLLAFAASIFIPQKRKMTYVVIGLGIIGSFIFYLAFTHFGRATIDVFNVIQKSTIQFIHGHNPYGKKYPAETFRPNDTHYFKLLYLLYGPGVVLFSSLGAFFGDIRISYIIAIILMEIAIVRIAMNTQKNYTHHEGHARLVLGMLVFCPLILPMIIFSWADVYSMALIVGWLYFREKQFKGHILIAMLCLALSFSVKFTAIIPLLPFFLWEKNMRKEITVGGIGTVIIMGIFALWAGVSNFYHDVFVQLFNLNFRPDAMTIPAYIYANYHVFMAHWIFPAAVLLGVFMVWIFRVRTYRDALLSGSLFFLMTLLFAKQAFLNYYFNVVIMLILAVAYDTRTLTVMQKIAWPFSCFQRSNEKE